jgi:hypothetical protein
VQDRVERATADGSLETEIAEACGVLNAATGRLVDVIAKVLHTGSWQVAGIHSAPQWVAWQCGVSPRRAATLVGMARRLTELPATRAALEAGALSEDQVAVVCRRAPAGIDAEVAELARAATVTQLSRVLNRYGFQHERRADAIDEERKTKADDERRPVPAAEPRRVSLGYSERGWEMSALLPSDEGAVVERALIEARDELFRDHEHDTGPGPSAADVSWADALVAMAERSLAAGAVARPPRDRHLVLLHLDTDNQGHLHLGPGLSEGLRRFLSCDSRVRPVFEQAKMPVNVGRAFRTVPDRTRVVVEERDRGCRVPGCDRSRWLHVHHIEHWEEGGTTDTANLIALCQHHHRLHHRGRLGIIGNADDPRGVVFSDENGRPLVGCGQAIPPGDGPLPSGDWVHPTGERLDLQWVHFNEEHSTA